MENALFSSDRIDWNTPQKVVDLVKKMGEIGLDPCSNPNSLVGARESLSLENGQDGLRAAWNGRGLVYCNPPYGRVIADWSRKMVMEGRGGTEIIALVPSRTDTFWMQLMLEYCNLCLFWSGRLTFLGAPSSAPFPSAIVYFGHREQLFCDVFGEHGKLLRKI